MYPKEVILKCLLLVFTRNAFGTNFLKVNIYSKHINTDPQTHHR